MLNKIKTSGFTIVELAVVIVVIAILALVVAVSFDSIQDHAHESATASNVELYVGAIEQAYQDDGKYPETFNLEFVCLGPKTSNNCSSGTISYYGAGCPADGAVLGGEYAVSETVNKKLLGYVDSLPDATTKSSIRSVLQTVETESGTCSAVYQTDGSLLYTSGIHVERKQSGQVSLWQRYVSGGGSNINVDAYKLEYVLPGEAECYSSGAVRSYVESMNLTSCGIYGGKTTYTN